MSGRFRPIIYAMETSITLKSSEPKLWFEFLVEREGMLEATEPCGG